VAAVGSRIRWIAQEPIVPPAVVPAWPQGAGEAEERQAAVPDKPAADTEVAGRRAAGIAVVDTPAADAAAVDRPAVGKRSVAVAADKAAVGIAGTADTAAAARVRLPEGVSEAGNKAAAAVQEGAGQRLRQRWPRNPDIPCKTEELRARTVGIST
jgi:hypothetical protein